MINFSQIAEQAIEQEKRNLLVFDGVHDSLIYAWPTVQHVATELIGRELDTSESELVQDYIYDYSDSILEVVEGHHLPTGYVDLLAVEEICIDLSHLHLTDSRRETISRYSDVSVSENYGYVYNLMALAVDLGAVLDNVIDTTEDVGQ